jgi:hypothetical protein
MAVAKIILSALDQPHQDKDSSQYTLNFWTQASQDVHQS